MLPFFQSYWKTPCWRQFLYIIDRGLVIAKLHNFSIRIEIPSWPWAYCGFNPLNFPTVNIKISQPILCIEYLACWKNAIVSCRLALLNKKTVKVVSLFSKGKDTLWNFSFRTFHEIQFLGHFVKHEILSWNTLTLVSNIHCVCFSPI